MCCHIRGPPITLSRAPQWPRLRRVPPAAFMQFVMLFTSKLRACFAPHNLGLLWQDDAKLTHQAANAVDGGRACGNKALAGAVHHQARLLFHGLDWHETHVGSLHGFADCGGIIMCG